MVRNGIGLVLTIFGNISFMITFHCCLYSIREEPSTRKPQIFSYIFSPFFIFCYLMAIFLFLPIFTHFYMIENFYILQIINILHVTIVYILVPSYNINQDSLLKFYVSVYHHQPPPVLPWQLPKNFHHDSIQLICAQPKNE